MATRITGFEMSSDVTRHTARFDDHAAADGNGAWIVTWLLGRLLTKNQAVTAMTIAEAVAEHADDLADNGSAWWLHIDRWAAELGITGPHAVAEASLPPEEHQERHDAERDAEDDEDEIADSALIDVMTAGERAWLLSFIAGYAPGVFVAALGARSETFAAELAARVDAAAEAEYMAEPDGFCAACGENVAWFIGHDGPQHFRGPHKLVTGAERRELFTPDDGHAPQVAWRQPGQAQDEASMGGTS